MNRNLPLASCPASARRQRGATLIVALVILLVMSIVGVASITSSTLQARMASNERQRMLSLYAAEAGLRAARMFLDQLAGPEEYYRFKDPGNGLYAATLHSDLGLDGAALDNTMVKTFGDKLYQPSAWDGDNSVEVNADDAKLPAVVKPPRYAIEYLGRLDQGGVRAIGGSDDVKPANIFVFRIVAVGWGQDPEIYSILNASYQTALTF
ncbi:MAG: PilX N-terminal domain-containing pilus assembly protein [Cellvibrionaceae bacterium]|nr:PilX N-terminal domain-containing pilus assembly protein [Cellvibrionaceae bacterium]